MPATLRRAASISPGGLPSIGWRASGTTASLFSATLAGALGLRDAGFSGSGFFVATSRSTGLATSGVALTRSVLTFSRSGWSASAARTAAVDDSTRAASSALTTTVIAFDLRQSDLPLQVAFPLLLSNVTGELLGLGDEANDPVTPATPVELVLRPGVEALRVTLPDGTAREVTPAEVALMPEAVEIIALELGVRFLADHVRGDSYFKLGPADPPDLNRVRGIAQLALFLEMRKTADEARQFVEALRAEFLSKWGRE